jgi:ADP-L-glycero-D-manno-heptose 6-epimerase
MSNILITGTSGFVGGHLGRKLQSLGHNVTHVPDPFYEHLPDQPFDVLFHQAAITDPQSTDRAEMLRRNKRDALELFRKAVFYGVKKIVYASSAAVYGCGEVPQREDQLTRPLTVYAASKVQLDMEAAYYSRLVEVPIVGLRYSNVYGPGEGHKGKNASVVYQLVQQMKRGERPRIFEHGEQSRDWVSVHDVVNANVLAMGDVPSGVYNVGSGTAKSFNTVVATINAVLGTDLAPEYIPNPYTATYQDRTCLDLTKSTAVLGYKPAVGLAYGVMELLDG